PQPPTEPPARRPLSAADLARRAELLALLRAQRGNVSAVAREMGVARMQVQRWCKRFRLDPASFRGG
ncbi:MAG TPA: helix-turn-helix domain-containing protein, partial [Myxococcaceae bacterium]|nr:helix-turn-helix domain-containing protein [Myxococcaceae bacterium]